MSLSVDDIKAVENLEPRCESCGRSGSLESYSLRWRLMLNQDSGRSYLIQLCHGCLERPLDELLQIATAKHAAWVKFEKGITAEKAEDSEDSEDAGEGGN